MGDRASFEVNELLALLQRRTLPQEFFDAFFRTLKQQGLCDWAAISFLHSDGETLVFGPLSQLSRARIHTGDRASTSQTDYFNWLNSELPRVIHLKKAEGIGVLKELRAAKYQVLAFVPITFNGAALGALWLAKRKSAPFSASELNCAKTMASLLALFLDRARVQSRNAIERLTKNKLEEENAQLRDILNRSPGLSQLLGESVPWRRLLYKIEQVATSESTVLIRGETGTGKELVARAIHDLSSRNGRPFIAVNCGALSPELINSELFGHERGAFTGANQRKIGRIELAQNGTLFLDEIGELNPEMQVKLLRVLQEHEFERVGGNTTLKSNARIIAATNRNLEEARKANRFRDDLFFRLNVFPISVPPLRERKEDIEPLLRHFLKVYSQKANRSFSSIETTTLERCVLYHWPGNVRELENLVERNVILCKGDVFSFDPLYEAELREDEYVGAATLDHVIKAHILRTLKLSGGKVYGLSGAAAMLGLKPSTLQAKMRKYGLTRKSAVTGI